MCCCRLYFCSFASLCLSVLCVCVCLCRASVCVFRSKLMSFVLWDYFGVWTNFRSFGIPEHKRVLASFNSRDRIPIMFAALVHIKDVHLTAIKWTWSLCCSLVFFSVRLLSLRLPSPYSMLKSWPFNVSKRTLHSCIVCEYVYRVETSH